MSLVQIKVIYDYYSSKRITPFYIGEEELLEYDFQAFKERLVREVPHLAKITSLSAAPLCITMNDEENEVDLSPVYFTFQFKEMLSKAKNITLQAFTFESPSVPGVGTDQCEVKTNLPPNRPKHLPTLLEAPRAKRSLQLFGSSKAEEYGSADLCMEESCETNDKKFGKISARCAPTKCQDNTTQQTPLQRYISKTEEQIDKKQEIIERLQNKENEILAKLERVKSDPRDGNICRKCLLRLGHSARTCQFGRSTSVFKCGEEKFHSGEINMKELRTQIKKNESELSKLRSEFDNKRMAVETMNDKVTNKIESELFQANRENYLVHGNKNWSLLRKHVYLVEQYSKKHFGGKIPAKEDVTAVLKKALDSSYGELSCTTNMSRSKQKRNREDNPAKSALERRGIKFPRQSSQDCRAETEEVNKPSSILYTAPKDEKEEAEQLAIVMRESLRHEAPNSTAAFPFSENDRYSSFPGPVLEYPAPCYPFYNCAIKMARMDYAHSLYDLRSTDTCTPTTSTNTNPVFTDCAPSSESQAKP